MIRNKVTFPLNFQKCGNQFFNFTNQTEVEEKEIAKYLCLDKDDYKFKGNFY